MAELFSVPKVAESSMAVAVSRRSPILKIELGNVPDLVFVSRSQEAFDRDRRS